MKRNSREPLLLILFICVSLISNAQKSLIPKDIKAYTLKTGDTIVFKYNNPDVSVTPHFGYQPDYANLTNYREGYMSETYHYVKHKKTVYGGYTYHGIYSIDAGRCRQSGTPLSDIHNHELVVISTSHNYMNYDTYYDTKLLNTAFNDTLIFRCVQYNSYTTKPTTIIVPKLERLIKERLVGGVFYYLMSKDDVEYESDRVVLSEYGTLMRYREYTITNCTIYYDGQYWIPDKGATPHIVLSYQDKNGKCFVFDDYNTSGNQSKYTYTKEEIDAKEIEWLEKRKNNGYYVFNLTKVDKPQNQNVKKGTLTQNNIYEDNIISIKWNEDNMQFYFNLKNMTNNTMKVIWDEALIVNFDGFTERVLHKGADMEALQKSQQPAIIPSLAQLADYYWSERYFGGKRLVSGYGGGNNGGINDGKQMRLILPVQIGNTTYTYSFTFTLKWEWSYPELRKQ